MKILKSGEWGWWGGVEYNSYLDIFLEYINTYCHDLKMPNDMEQVLQFTENKYTLIYNSTILTTPFGKIFIYNKSVSKAVGHFFFILHY